MTDHLFEPPEPDTIARMTDRQRRAWKHITIIPGGVTADELGAHLHNHADAAPRCEWCATAGRDVATSAALKPLVIYRRSTHKFEPRDPAHRAKEPSSQLEELPGSSFEDIFEMGDAA